MFDDGTEVYGFDLADEPESEREGKPRDLMARVRRRRRRRRSQLNPAVRLKLAADLESSRVGDSNGDGRLWLGYRLSLPLLPPHHCSIRDGLGDTALMRTIVSVVLPRVLELTPKARRTSRIIPST